MQMNRWFDMLKWFQEKHATPVLINSKVFLSRNVCFIYVSGCLLDYQIFYFCMC